MCISAPSTAPPAWTSLLSPCLLPSRQTPQAASSQLCPTGAALESWVTAYAVTDLWDLSMAGMSTVAKRWPSMLLVPTR